MTDPNLNAPIVPPYQNMTRPSALRFVIVGLILILTTPIWQVLSFLPFAIFAPAEVTTFAIGSVLFSYPFGLIGTLIVGALFYRFFDRLKLWDLWRCIWLSALSGFAIVGLIWTAVFVFSGPDADFNESYILFGFFGVPPAIVLTVLFRALILRKGKADDQ